jgi:hypothetical protein
MPEAHTGSASAKVPVWAVKGEFGGTSPSIGVTLQLKVSFWTMRPFFPVGQRITWGVFGWGSLFEAGFQQDGD